MFSEIFFWVFCLQLVFASGQTQGVDGQLHLQYIGCFKGNGSSQVIATPLQNDLTIDQCIRKCYNTTTPRMTFAGLSNGTICVCSDHFGLQVSESECQTKCSGYDNQYCGGLYTTWNPVYSVYAVCEIGSFGGGCRRQCHCKDQLPCERRTGLCQGVCEDHWDGVSCNESKVDVENEFIGCYKANKTAPMDKKNPGGKTGSHSMLNSVEFCIEICSSYNNYYSYAGMQYGYDCNCGEQYDRYGESHGCNYKCPGNESQTCGGNYTNSVYHACPTGFYGRNCTKRCNCANGARCSKTECPSGHCKPGWTGATCNSRDCLDNNGDCGPYLQCTTIDLSYASVNDCRCKDGYLKLESKCIKTAKESFLGVFGFGAIVGSSVGAFLVLASIAIVVLVFCWKRRNEVNQPPQRQCSQVHNGSGVENNYGNPTVENNHGNHIIYMELDQTALGMGRKTTNNTQMGSFNRLPIPMETPKETAQAPVYGNVQSSIYATVVSSVDDKA